jgi:hypothetical protein
MWDESEADGTAMIRHAQVEKKINLGRRSTITQAAGHWKTTNCVPDQRV